MILYLQASMFRTLNFQIVHQAFGINVVLVHAASDYTPVLLRFDLCVSTLTLALRAEY